MAKLVTFLAADPHHAMIRRPRPASLWGCCATGDCWREDHFGNAYNCVSVQATVKRPMMRSRSPSATGRLLCAFAGQYTRVSFTIQAPIFNAALPLNVADALIYFATARWLRQGMVNRRTHGAHAHWLRRAVGGDRWLFSRGTGRAAGLRIVIPGSDKARRPSSRSPRESRQSRRDGTQRLMSGRSWRSSVICTMRSAKIFDSASTSRCVTLRNDLMRLKPHVLCTHAKGMRKTWRR